MGSVAIPSSGGKEIVKELIHKTATQSYMGSTTASFNQTLSMSIPDKWMYIGCTNTNITTNGGSGTIRITGQSITPSSSQPSCSFSAGLQVDTTGGTVTASCDFIFARIK